MNHHKEERDLRIWHIDDGFQDPGLFLLQLRILFVSEYDHNVILRDWWQVKCAHIQSVQVSGKTRKRHSASLITSFSLKFYVLRIITQCVRYVYLLISLNAYYQIVYCWQTWKSTNGWGWRAHSCNRQKYISRMLETEQLFQDTLEGDDHRKILCLE